MELQIYICEFGSIGVEFGSIEYFLASHVHRYLMMFLKLQYRLVGLCFCCFSCCTASDEDWTIETSGRVRHFIALQLSGTHVARILVISIAV